jgi:hypothetical protein
VRTWRLRTPAEIQTKSAFATAQANKETAALRIGKAWEADKIGEALQQLRQPLPRPTRMAQLPDLELAGLPIDQVTSRILRNWLRNQATKTTAASLQNRKIGKSGEVPENVWRWVHHPIKSTQIQEIHYKLIFNALPLASRTRFFTGNDQCYACPGATQDIEHFISTCWVAQEIWKSVRELEATVSTNRSWMTKTSHHFFGGVSEDDPTPTKERHLFLHGIALESAWLTYTNWIFEKEFPSVASIHNLFKRRLKRSCQILHGCKNVNSEFLQCMEI